MRHIARPGRLDIDDETAVTWDPETLEVTHLDLGSYSGDEPTGEALVRLGHLMRRQDAASAIMQQCMEALMKRRLATEPASTRND